jgi:hypothetical protein
MLVIYAVTLFISLVVSAILVHSERMGMTTQKTNDRIEPRQ